MNSDQEKPLIDSEKEGANANDLQRRLEKLGERISKRRQLSQKAEKNQGRTDNKGMAYGLKIGAEFVSAILVGSALGWVLDYWLGTTPFGLLFFLIMGFAAGVLNVMRSTGQMKEPGAKDR